MNEEIDRNGPNGSGRDKEIGALEALWSFFSSMKTAIVLLLVLALASIAGTIVEQNQPDAYYVKEYGSKLHALLKTTGLTNVYHSTWYSVLLAMVGMGLAVCSINRFGMAWRRTFQPVVATGPDKVGRMQRSEKLAYSGNLEDAAGKVAAALRSRLYHITKETQGDSISLHAARGRLSIWGPYLTHVSILVIFIAAIFGNLLGFNGHMSIWEGKNADTYNLESISGKTEQKKLDFKVGLRKFNIAYETHRVNGSITHDVTGYKSDLTVYDHGKPVVRKVIDVNHPLTYKGISFFQSSYGLVGIYVKVTAPDGRTERIPFSVDLGEDHRTGGLAYVVTDQPYKIVDIGGKKLTVFVHGIDPDFVRGERVMPTGDRPMPFNPAAQLMVNDRFPEYKGMDAWTRLGLVPESESVDYKGFKISLDEVIYYTYLQVSQNPALPAIYVGFSLMVVGVFISLYVTHKVIRVSVSPSSKGVTLVAGATSRAEPGVFDKDFGNIRDALR
ncbi:MAG: hypothetical protein A2Z18_00300 [Armatimonadetes bacterium RBG_16_58_9]|nr:MAG: hypothetical protein A2Z18_00300 [Armatimonadetes bacterium RBG_16_58_9]